MGVRTALGYKEAPGKLVSSSLMIEELKDDEDL